MDPIDKGDQITSTPDQAGITKNTMRERSPGRPNGLSDVEWQEQQALQRQPHQTAVLADNEDDGTPDALLHKGGVSKGFDVAGLRNSSPT